MKERGLKAKETRSPFHLPNFNPISKHIPGQYQIPSLGPKKAEKQLLPFKPVSLPIKTVFVVLHSVKNNTHSISITSPHGGRPFISSPSRRNWGRQVEGKTPGCTTGQRLFEDRASPASLTQGRTETTRAGATGMFCSSPHLHRQPSLGTCQPPISILSFLWAQAH